MKKTDVAYYAGIFDGEGCIVIRKGKLGYHNLMIAVSNTNEWLCRQFQFSFGGGTRLRSLGTDTRQAVWVWQAYSEVARVFLTTVFPYLRIKKAQAEIAIKFADRIREHRGGTHRVSDEELALREVARILISNINRPLQNKTKGGK